MENKQVLVTAGPTYEPIDPVRFIANHSSGKMGYALAGELAARGAIVTLISGPVHIAPPAGVNLHRVTTAAQMYDACIDCFAHQDMAILSAAVADYTPTVTASEKIKKADGELNLSLSKTKDILRTLGSMKKDNQVLVGFALETHNEKEFAIRKAAN